MKLLLQEIRRNPLLWLLVFVPIALVAEKLNHEAHTLHFILSVLAILPLAFLLSHATESVAAKTGDSVGGLLNATLGNLTELVICFSLNPHRELFASAREEHDTAWTIGLAVVIVAVVTILVALVSEVFVGSVQQAATAIGMSPAFVGFIIVALVGAAAEMT